MNPRVVLNTTLIVTAVCYGVVAAVASGLPLVGWLVPFLVIFSLLRFGYEVLRCFAQGHRDVPAPDFETVNPFSRWSYLLHFIAFPGAIAVVQIYLPAAWILALPIAALYPASAALMAITKRLESAFSPVALAGLIRLLGRDYLWLIGAMLIVAAGVALLGNVMSRQGGFLAMLGLVVVDGWLLLGVFALSGSAIHAHRLDLDVPGGLPDPAERARADRERAWQTILDQAYASLRGGRPEAGYQELRRFLAEQGQSRAAWYWVVEHLFDWEDKRHALEVAARLIATEIEAGRTASAFELYRRCRRLGGAGIGPAEAAALGHYAASIGQHGAASELAELARPAAPGA